MRYKLVIESKGWEFGRGNVYVTARNKKEAVRVALNLCIEVDRQVHSEQFTVISVEEWKGKE